MAKIRICQIITELRLSGAERVVYELATRLDPERFEVEVVGLRGGQVQGMLQSRGIPADILGVGGKWDLLKLPRLAGLLKRGHFDLVHTHLFHADLAGRFAAAMAGVPHLVHSVHVAEQRFRPWQFAFWRMFASRCDRIICVSPSVRDFHAARTHLPLSRYEVIPNGIDLQAYRRDEAARRRMREQWGVGEDQIVALFVGRLDYQKGIDTLLAAAETTHARNPRVKFVLAGDGPQRPLVEQFLARHPAANCCYMGFARDVPAALSGADIFVLPSRWEGFGLALTEAMAASLPCVATNVFGICDVIEPDRSGLLVPREDAPALAAAIERLADDPALRHQLAQGALQRVTDHFSIDRNVRAHEDLYERIISQR